MSIISRKERGPVVVLPQQAFKKEHPLKPFLHEDYPHTTIARAQDSFITIVNA